MRSANDPSVSLGYAKGCQPRSAALFTGTVVDVEPVLRSRSMAVLRSWQSKFAVEPQRQVKKENRVVRHPATTEVVIG